MVAARNPSKVHSDDNFHFCCGVQGRHRLVQKDLRMDTVVRHCTGPPFKSRRDTADRIPACKMDAAPETTGGSEYNMEKQTTGYT